ENKILLFFFSTFSPIFFFLPGRFD
ncbi:hypothetical protein EE612_059955, partial [Oryza sativa]